MKKNWIPNFFTSLNLVFGVFAIIAVFNSDFTLAAYFVVGAVVADSFDGRVARYLGVSGDFGKELDSLCDLGSFGVAPAVIAYVFMLKDCPNWHVIFVGELQKNTGKYEIMKN